MSYQVLARKWRPQTFHQLVGQDHVKQALVNALNEQRLHHAYLFTGTRGVGKTTIARIFAKSLNCEQGISAQPCGQCSTCLDIEAGKYIDLIEIDAASRTKVEDTREILDNVQYAPTRGQFKVYLIDEVHMLSKHSFNALLKTLEEPPEHVKFLLATTDPQKLPVTILSRCLQFNLSALSVPQISTQLQHILGQEQIHYEDSALAVLAKAADGSMRDALSLTDQAIAQTNGQLVEEAVKDMLGLMDVRFAQQLLSAVLLHDGAELMQQTRALAQRNPNYVAVLDDLLNLMHSIQLTQLVPSAAALSERDAEYVSAAARSADPQHIHTLYQLLLSGKRDLQWSSSPQVGFEMLMLRLLAFEPAALASMPTAPANVAEMASPKASGQEQAANLRAMLARNNNELASAPKAAKPEPVSAPEVPSASSAPTVEMDEEVAQEQEAAAQFDAVLQQAQELGYQGGEPAEPNTAEPGFQHQAALEQVPQGAVQEQDQVQAQPHIEQMQSVSAEQMQPVSPEQDSQGQAAPAEQLHALEEQTQSAIARILQNRKLATPSATPSPAAAAGQRAQSRNEVTQGGDDLKKAAARGERAELSASPGYFDTAVATAVAPAVATAEPAQQQQQQQQQQEAAKRKQTPAQRLLDRHQPDPQKLAPELLQQLQAPVTNAEAQEQPLVIPVPEGFTSSISDIKFAHQQDAWAALIDEMNLGGRTRQFALQSCYRKEQNQVFLQVDASQQHLDGPALRERLVQCFSEQLGEPIELHIEFSPEVAGTPKLIQEALDAQRLQQAVAAMHSDHNVQRLMTQFSANLDENSVQPL
ncbi:DNA polymerase III subunit gamma/tau [Pseudoalteromonas sp. T1lg88]|uniref:DNA polymerase III subunit gamma/tau n=1 Tax=Pseudoalteromonas sp. T1lg88 TaxID=2077104 RepID=UPI000CF65C70|nr:DNA polymerase III subunit gamma/tau [Pseudoalteromonas sp. T1lg88]